MNHPGLCIACAWTRVIESRRGSVFFLCGRAKEDPTFPRYPAIPVLTCRGFQARVPAEDAEDDGSPVE